MRETLHQSKSGWMMSIVLVMKQVLQGVVMADGVRTTAGTVRMWEWSANIHQKRCKVGHFNSSVVIFETVLL